MNEWESSSSSRMRKDLKFKNIILKNCSRLRRESNDDYIKYKKYKHRRKNEDKLINLTNYKNYEINNLPETNNNISFKINYNLIQNNNYKQPNTSVEKKINFEKNVQESTSETERTNENNIYDDIKKNDILENMKINEHKNIKVDCDNTRTNQKRKNIYEKYSNRKNTHDIKFHNNQIKNLIIDLKEKNSNNIKTRKSGMKRSSSVSKIIKYFYYDSYPTKTDNDKKVVLALTPKVRYKMNGLNLIKKPGIKENEVLTNEESIINKNFDFNRDNNNLYAIKPKNYFYTDISNIYKKQKNNFLSTANENKEIKLKNGRLKNLVKEKMIYHKPDETSYIEEQIKEKSRINYKINTSISKRKLFATEINSNETETIKKEIKENKNINQGKIFLPIGSYTQRRNKFRNIEANTDKLNNNNIFSNMEEKKDFYLDSGNKKNKEKENFIIEFFDDIIELCNGIKEKTIFEILIKKINKKYFINYDSFSFEENLFDIKNNFIYCFKYFCIILISFYFLSKEDDLYKNNYEKIHLLFIQYIYSSLCFVGYQDLNSKKIKRFLNDYNLIKKVSIIQCTTFFIKLLFLDKEEYTSIINILKQLMVNIRITSAKDIIKIINQTILFCFNQIPDNKNTKYFQYLYNNHYIRYRTHKEENNIEKPPSVPYIKTSLRKTFCLVLDLDETILHSLRLNFGHYFFLRPGTIELLNELSEFYEIIIFTSSPKEYADDIIDKIDPKGILILHRLYKSHVIFEKKKTVKNLNLIGRDLNKIVFVDNIKCNAKYNPKNLYLIPSWTDDIFDDEIYKLKNKLLYIYESGKFNDDITKGL